MTYTVLRFFLFFFIKCNFTCLYRRSKGASRWITFVLISVKRIVSFIIRQTLNLLFITLIIKIISAFLSYTLTLFVILSLIAYSDSIRWKIAQMQLFRIYFEIKWNVKLTRDQACENIRNSFALCQYFLRRYRRATIDGERGQMSKNSFIMYTRFSNSFRVDKTFLICATEIY